MKIFYKDDMTKKSVYSWLNDCTDPLVAYKIKDNTILRPNQIMVFKSKLLKRIIMETNCFNEDVNLFLSLEDSKNSINPVLNFTTSEGEMGRINLRSASMDSMSSISIIQGDQKRVFFYDYLKNPTMYKGNLLKEYIQEEQRKNIR